MHNFLSISATKNTPWRTPHCVPMISSFLIATLFGCIAQTEAILSGAIESCGPLPQVKNAHPLLDAEPLIFVFGQRVAYSCNKGYRRIWGSDMALCRRDELGHLSWRSPSLNCQVVCHLPPVVPNAHPLLPSPTPNIFLHNHTVEYSCDPGFIPTGGSNEALCLVKGSSFSWTIPSLSCFPEAESEASTPLIAAEAQRHFEVVAAPPPYCGALPSLSNAEPEKIAPQSPVGARVKFRCLSGFTRISGNDMALCLQVTKNEAPRWLLPTLDCQVVCPLPPAITNANIVSPQSSYHLNNSIVEYTCSPGHIGSNSSSTKAICIVKGLQASWHLNSFSCKPVDCGSPGQVANGKFLEPVHYTFPNSLKVKCNVGYQRHGSPEIHCLASGHWSDRLPKCLAIPCTRILPPSNGNLTFIGNPTFSYGTTLKFACYEGYKLSGQETITCLSNGTWSGQTPKCQEIICPVPDYIPGQSQDPIVSSNKLNGLMILRCIIPSDVATRRCIASGKWDPPPHCPIPPTRPPPKTTTEMLKVQCEPPNVSISHGIWDMNPEKNTIIFTCLSGYVLRGGPSTLRCLPQGVWNKETLPFCAKALPIALIIGASIGGLVILCLIIASAIFGFKWWHKRQRLREERKADARDAHTWEEMRRLQQDLVKYSLPTTVL